MYLDMATEQLLNLIRSEYREMPGLRLDLTQACRLWHLEHATCVIALEQLVAERFLQRTETGMYIALTDLRPRQAKASLDSLALGPRRIRKRA